MNTYDEMMNFFTDALVGTYGDQLDSVFDFFWAADDVTENSCVNVGIVTKGACPQDLRDYVAELVAEAKKVYRRPIKVTCFSAHEYLTIAEELEIGRLYWMNGARSNLNLTSPAVTWYDGTGCPVF